MQDNAVESISGCSYENICDEGMEISVGGKKRLLPVDTVVICAGACLSRRRANTFLAIRPCSRARVMFRDTPYFFFQVRSPCAIWRRD
jgi:hypothetical protein